MKHLALGSKLLPYVLSVGCLLPTLPLEAQSGQSAPSVQKQEQDDLIVAGVVKEESGLPAVGATVQVRGTNTGVVTDAHGRFQIKVKVAAGQLEISYLGFVTQIVAYSTSKSISVTLKEASKKLEEVSVVAYGRKATKDLVGSIGSVKAAQIENMPTPSIDNLLQGKLSGVQVTNSGGPGSASKVVIRGNNSMGNGKTSDSPLYVIDGVPVRPNTGVDMLASLDPSTIESVEVLKDAASAALYGSRASNGVIMITTKKGKSGRPQFLVNVSQSISYLPETPLQVVGKAERDWWIRLAKARRATHYEAGESPKMPNSYADTWGWDEHNGAYDYFWNNGKRNDFTPIPSHQLDSLNAFYNNQSHWWNYKYRVGHVTKADLHILGGNDNTRYMLGGGIYDEKGIEQGTRFQRANVLGNLDIRLSPKVDIFTRLSMAYTDRAAGEATESTIKADPTTTPTVLPGKGSIVDIKTKEMLSAIKAKNNVYNVRLNVGLNYTPINGLRLSSSAAVDHHVRKSNLFIPSFLNTAEPRANSSADVGMMTLIQTENILSYNFKVGQKHSVDLMTGVTYTKEQGESFEGKAYFGMNDKVHYINDAYLDRLEEYGIVRPGYHVRTNLQEQAMLSYLGRFSYNYDQRYLAELSVRRDGSSVFKRSTRWGTFPAVGLGWIFSSERFLKDFWWLSFGKLRFSWGRSGQKLDDPYLVQGTMDVSNYVEGGTGFVPSIVANQDISWEKSEQYDLGADLYFLDHKLRFKVDYYYKYTSDLLMEVPLPGNVYFLKKFFNNVGAISNEGLEFELAADIIKKKDLEWTAQLNLSRNWNLVRQLPFGNRDLQSFIVGRPSFGIYVYADDGFIHREEDIPYYYNPQGVRENLRFGFNSTNFFGVGARKIKDLDQDGRITESDKYYAGTTLPIAHGGFSSQLRWKNWTLDALLNFSIGNKMLNMARRSSLAFSLDARLLWEDPNQVSFWEKAGDQAMYPHISYADASLPGQFDGDIDSFIETVHYLRLKQLTLSYTLPTDWLSKLGAKTTKLYLTGENLFLLTNYSGLDPETVNPITGKDDGKQYPLDRKITLGLNIKF